MDSEPLNNSTSFMNEYKTEIIDLETQKINAAKEKRYADADAIQTRITLLKKVVLDRKKKDLEISQSYEMDSLEQTYRKELDEFNGIWDKKVLDFDEESKKLEETLRIKQAKDLEEFEAELEKKHFKPTQQSKVFIELRSQEDALVKQQRYKEAHLIKKKVDHIERHDSEQWSKTKNEKVGTASDHLKAKQELEYNAFRKKVDVQFEVIRKERDIAFNIILNRFKNKKFDLDKQHKKAKLFAENESLNKAKTGYQMVVSKVKKGSPGSSKVIGGSTEL